MPFIFSYMLGIALTYLAMSSVTSMFENDETYVDKEALPREEEIILLSIIWPFTWAISLGFIVMALFRKEK